MGSPSSLLVVAAAAAQLGDPELSKLVPALPPGVREHLLERTRQLSGDPRELLPESEAPRLQAGYTVRSVEPRVGRNDPCPCGSGKKYKKCCGGSTARPSRPPSASGLVERHFEPGGARLIGDDQFKLLRPHELARLAPEDLSTLRLIQGFRRLALFRRWEAAEAWVTALAQRTDHPGGGDPREWWEELADAALDAGDVDRVARYRERLDPNNAEGRKRLELALLILRGDAVLDQLDQAVREDLDGEQADQIYGIAFRLLERYPALGLFFARGCLQPARALDGDMIMSAVERARDHLGLSIEDPYWEVWERMLDGPAAKTTAGTDTDSEGVRELRERVAQSRLEIEGLDRELSGSRRRLAELEGALLVAAPSVNASTPGAELSRDDTPRPAQPPGPGAAPTSDSASAAGEAADDRRRLRQRIAELEQRIREGAEERRGLRQTLLAERKQQRLAPPSRRSEEHGEAPEAREEPYTMAASESVPLRVPRLTEEQRVELEGLEGGLGSAALRCLGELAGAVPRAWRQVKQLRKKRDLFSVRLGLHHRLLFSISPSELRLVAVIHRKNLERYLSAG